MNHTEKLTRYTANFVDELILSGLRHVVISPGSRSTPLAMLFHAHKGIKNWVLVDERSAAFFALGIAKGSNNPVALVCTSGTAAANYLPAIIEAYYSRVPLIVLTADRPHELRGIGAPQTIQQIHLYGHYVKDFQEMAMPEGTDAMLQYVRNRAARAIRIASQENPGPVHLNFPFREPLVPDLGIKEIWGSRKTAYHMLHDGKKRLTEEQLEVLATTITQQNKGLIVCGPQVDDGLLEPLHHLSEKLGVPIFADPISQCRVGIGRKDNIVSTYDTILREAALRKELRPDYIIRFGAMPISKNYLFYVQENNDCLQYIVEHGDDVREPTNHPSQLLFSDSMALCIDLIDKLPGGNKDNPWLDLWREKDQATRQILMQHGDAGLTEGKAVKTVCQMLPEMSDLFIANSMPVRDLDTFLMPTEKQIVVHANRGASGIDGIISSALGVAAVSTRHVTLIIGDLSFYHDMNGLLAAKQYHLNLTIVLLNNNGGGIFSFLPQASDEDYFEALFGTPLHIDFGHAVKMYGGNFAKVDDRAAFIRALEQSYATKGLSVIEVCTDRNENVAWHRGLWERVKQGLISDGNDQ